MANKKLVMLEEFEQINKKSDCGCGGNCQCNKSVNEAKKLNIKRISIETGAGDFFIPARKLFKRTGFSECEPFAHYKVDINSVYLTKKI